MRYSSSRAALLPGLPLAALPVFAAILVLATLPAIASPAQAQRQQNVPQKDAPPKDMMTHVEKYKLPNGLEVLFSEDHRLPVVAVNIWYHVGPMNEVAGRTGFAHLFEHMMFQGSKHVPVEAHFGMLQRAGSTNMNGTTDFDRTNYYETVPSHQLELALWLESDRMGYLLDVLDQAKLTNQQDVVRNERRQSYENVPYQIVGEALYHNLFPRQHPYYAAVIGSHVDIQAAKLADVKDFFRQYYVPNNATISIVGDADSAQVRQLVTKYFGSLKRGADVPKVNVVTPPITSERRAVIEDRIELPRVYMAWLIPPAFQPGEAEARLLAHILGGGDSSRLHQKLVYEKQVAQDASAWEEADELSSILTLEATARPGYTPQELEQLMQQELERMQKDGPDAAELEGARNIWEMRLVDRMQTVGGAADMLNYYNQVLGKPDYVGQDIARLRAVTAAQVRDFARRLKPNSRVVIYGVPGKQKLDDVPTPKLDPSVNVAAYESVNADEPWRSQPPQPAAEHAMQLPVPKVAKLSNGLTILLTERPNLPVVSARLVLRTGSDSDPLGKAGIASFTAAMLDQGTATRTAPQLAKELARLGVNLSTDSSMDDTSAEIRSLKRNFSDAMHLLADVVLHPAFPTEEITRQRASRLAELVQRRNQAPVVADNVFSAVLYGPPHPYSVPTIGTEGSIRATSRDDMVAFWKQNIVPGNAALVVAGDITMPELQALAEKELGSWKGSAPAERELAAPAEPETRMIIVDKPGAAQTQLRVGMVGAPRSTPDYAALEIMNTALGGAFNSRINLNLREDKGYTYGANSRFNYRRGAGPFSVRTGVRTDVTAPAVAEILKEIRRIGDEPLSTDELTLARDSAIRSLPGRFETTQQLVTSFANVFTYNLGIDYFTRLPGMFSAVDGAAVEAVVKKYLAPDRMLVVAVGDRARIEGPLDQLGIGTFELRDTDGALIATPAANVP